MIDFKTRFHLALLAFRCRDFELAVKPSHVGGELWPNEDRKCDNKCSNLAAVCMTRTWARFEIRSDDHEHLCESCASKIKGT